MAKQNFYTYPSMEKQLKQWTVQYSADYFRLDSIGLLVSTPDQKKIDFLYPQISLPIIPAIAVY